jgi:hypothetical protein
MAIQQPRHQPCGVPLGFADSAQKIAQVDVMSTNIETS